MLGCTTVALWRLYFDPVVYAFDPFFGWFSGPIYDEAVAIDSRYRWFRFYNLLSAGAALGLWWTLFGDGRTGPIYRRARSRPA